MFVSSKLHPTRGSLPFLSPLMLSVSQLYFWSQLWNSVSGCWKTVSHAFIFLWSAFCLVFLCRALTPNYSACRYNPTILCVFLGSVLKLPLVFSETRYQKSHPWILFFPSWRTKIMAQIFFNYYISRVEEVLSFAKFYGALGRLAQRGQNAKKCQNFQKNPLFSLT